MKNRAYHFYANGKYYGFTFNYSTMIQFRKQLEHQYGKDNVKVIEQ